MCQIQFIKRYDGNLGFEEIEKFIDMMNLGDVGNNDAWGIFNSVYSCKASGSFRQRLIDYNKLFQSNFIVGHNRFATSGKYTYKTVKVDANQLEQQGNYGSQQPFWTTYANMWQPQWMSSWGVGSLGGLALLVMGVLRDKSCRGFGIPKDATKHKGGRKKKKVSKIEVYKRIIPIRENHPFRIGGLIMVHNGVIFNHNYLVKKFHIREAEKIHTDSYVFLWLIDHFMKRSRAPTRRERLAEGIREAEDQIEGSYSIFLHDLIANKLYYFKNYATDFKFYQINDAMLVGSTSEEVLNETFIEDIKEKNLEKSEKRIRIYETRVKNRILYEITNNSNEPIKGICKFKSIISGFSWHDDNSNSSDAVEEKDVAETEISNNVTTEKRKDKYIKNNKLNKLVENNPGRIKKDKRGKK